MKKFEISTQEKKNAVEVRYWYKDEMTIRHEIGWRWGSGVVIVANDKEERALLKAVKNEDVSVYDYHDFELWSLEDGCWEDVEYSENIPEEEKERLEELFSENQELGWEEDGWSDDDYTLRFTGPIELKKIEEKPEPKKKSSKKAATSKKKAK